MPFHSSRINQVPWQPFSKLALGERGRQIPLCGEDDTSLGTTERVERGRESPSFQGPMYVGMKAKTNSNWSPRLSPRRDIQEAEGTAKILGDFLLSHFTLKNQEIALLERMSH